MKKLSAFAVCVASLSMFAGAVAAPPQCDYREFRKDQAAFFDGWRAYVAENTAEKDIKVSGQVGDNYFVTLRCGLPGVSGRNMEGKSSPAYEFINRGETPVKLPGEVKSQAVIFTDKAGVMSIAGVAFGDGLNYSTLMALDHAGAGDFELSIGGGYNLDWCGFSCGLTAELNMVMNGLQVGLLYAKATALNGMQIGILNRARYSDSLGIQIGILNSNGRFTLPGMNIVW